MGLHKPDTKPIYTKRVFVLLIVLFSCSIKNTTQSNNGVFLLMLTYWVEPWEIMLDPFSLQNGNFV